MKRLIRAPIEVFPGGGAVPAYRLRAGQSGAEATADDLAFDRTTEVGEGVEKVLQEVGSDPRAAYLWVRNQVVYEPYHGVKRGAEGVAWEKVGNSFDQAALLVALLRSQGVPARFVYGVVRLQGTKLAEWLGMASAEEAYKLLVQAGVPAHPIYVGGRIEVVEVNHCWVEAKVPYTNPGYQGHGEGVWIPLDPSYKKHELQLGADLFPRLGFQEEEFLFDLLAQAGDPSPEDAFREVIRTKLQDVRRGGLLSDAAWKVRIVPEGQGALPLTLSPDLAVKGVIWEQARIPDTYRYRIRLTVYDGTDDGRGVTPGDIQVTFDTAYLTSHFVSLGYRPATPDDQALADNAPAATPYDPTIRGEIRLAPVVLVDGEPIDEVSPGSLIDGAAPEAPFGTGNIGVRHKLVVETLFPATDPDAFDQPGVKFDVELAVGEYYALGATVGVVSPDQMQHLVGKVLSFQQQKLARGVLSNSLSLAALQYLHSAGTAARVFARLLGVRYLQEPTFLLCGLRLDPSAGVMSANGLFFDVRQFLMALVSRDGRPERERAFLFLAGLQSSYLEHEVLEKVFVTSAVCAVRVLRRSHEIGLEPQLVTADNLEASLAHLSLSTEQKDEIRRGVLDGQHLIIPPQPLQLENWWGWGYILWDPDTGSGGYIIQGGLAGGSVSGLIPSFLVKLYLMDVCGNDWTIVRTLVVDPELGEEHYWAAFVKVPALAEDTPYIASLLVLPKDYPLDNLDLVYAGKYWSDPDVLDNEMTAARRVPRLFVASRGAEFEAVALCLVNEGNPDGDKLTLKPRKVQMGSAGTGEIAVDDVTWSVPDRTPDPVSPDGSGGCVYDDAAPRPGGEALVAEVAYPAQYPGTVYGHAVLVAPADVVEPSQIQNADAGIAVLTAPGGSGGMVHVYATDAQGRIQVPATAVGQMSLNGDLYSLGILLDTRFIGYELSDITLPGVYTLIVLDGNGVAQRVQLRVGEVDVDVDSDNDAGFDAPPIWARNDSEDRIEDDATLPGKYLAVNADDDDADGVPDFADGYGLFGGGGTAGERFVSLVLEVSPGVDVDTAVLAIGYDASAPSGVTTTGSGADRRYDLPSSGKMRIWTRRGSDARDPAEPSVTGGGDYLAPGRYPLRAVGFDGATWTRSLYVEAVKSSAQPGDLRVEIKLDPDGDGPVPATLSDAVRLTALDIPMIVDYDRDGVIDEGERWQVSGARPWRFWINDDRDAKADSVTGTVRKALDDLPGQDVDNGDEKVNGLRDLIDFFPLYLDLSQTLRLCPPDQGYVYRLLQGDGAVGVVEPTVGGGVLRTGAGQYLNDPEVGSNHLAAASHQVTTGGTQLGASFLTSAGQPGKGVVFVEGLASTDQPLVLTVGAAGGAELARFTLPIEISSVLDMYARKDLRPVAGGGAAPDDRYLTTDPPKRPYCTQGVEKNLVWLHGYNVDVEAATATFAEVFKRLFHSGLEGRFYGVSWYGDPPAFGAPHYHEAVVNALATAEPFADFVGGLTGPIGIVAHSLGNLVVSEAIENHALSFDTYIAMDAAVALETYGQVAVVDSMLAVGTWPDYVAAGEERLLAGEWYKLFPATDHRSELTWRRRLESVPSAKVYNFYSESEDVLRPYAGDNLVADGAGWSNLGMYAWVKQEKFKGRRANVLKDIGGATSDYAGWSLNPAWTKEVEDEFGDPLSRQFTPEETKTEITDEMLKATPFFAPRTNNLAALLDPNLDNLVADDANGTTPSEFVMKMVSQTNLDGYYTHNTPAHQVVTVMDWLLAEAFPATTLPAGVNPNETLNLFLGHNIDMPSMFMRQWPSEREGEWLHGDYKDISYQYVYRLYDKVANDQ